MARLEDPRVALKPRDLRGGGLQLLLGQRHDVAQQVAEIADEVARHVRVLTDQAADRVERVEHEVRLEGGAHAGALGVAAQLLALALAVAGLVHRARHQHEHAPQPDHRHPEVRALARGFDVGGVAIELVDPAEHTNTCHPIAMTAPLAAARPYATAIVETADSPRRSPRPRPSARVHGTSTTNAARNIASLAVAVAVAVPATARPTVGTSKNTSTIATPIACLRIDRTPAVTVAQDATARASDEGSPARRAGPTARRPESTSGRGAHAPVATARPLVGNLPPVVCSAVARGSGGGNSVVMTSRTHQMVRLAIAMIVVGCGGEQVREAPRPGAAGPAAASPAAAGPAAAGPAAAGPVATGPAAGGDAKSALAGAWAGKLEIPGQPLGIELVFAPDGTGTIDIPAQGASGLALSQIAVSGTAVTFELAQVGASFHGVLQGTGIAGTMTQRGQSVPFSLSRRAAVVKDAYTPPPPAPPPTAASGAALVGAWHGFVEQASGKAELVVELSSDGGAGTDGQRRHSGQGGRAGESGAIVGAAALGGGCARLRPLSGLAFAAPRVHFALTPATAPAAYFDGELAGTQITGTLHQGGAARRFSLTRVAPAARRRTASSRLRSRRRATPRSQGRSRWLAAPPPRRRSCWSPAPDRRTATSACSASGRSASSRTHLARHGVASLRYDDRGTARSTGEFATATAVEFADDAEAAVRFLGGRRESMLAGSAYSATARAG